MVLRSLSLGSRFILLFVLARLLKPSDVGIYGLMTATIAFSVLVLGGDYYTYSQRELMAGPGDMELCGSAPNRRHRHIVCHPPAAARAGFRLWPFAWTACTFVFCSAGGGALGSGTESPAGRDGAPSSRQLCDVRTVIVDLDIGSADVECRVAAKASNGILLLVLWDLTGGFDGYG